MSDSALYKWPGGLLVRFWIYAIAGKQLVQVSANILAYLHNFSMPLLFFPNPRASGLPAVQRSLRNAFMSIIRTVTNNLTLFISSLVSVLMSVAIQLLLTLSHKGYKR